MSAAGYVLGQLIGLALIPAVLIWVLRGTRPGRVVWDAVMDLVKWRQRRARDQRDRCTHDAYAWWVAQLAYWGHQLQQHAPGTRTYELAHDIIVNLEANQPPRCHCPACSFTDPRSHRP